MAEIGGAPTLRTYLTVLRRRKWWVILIALMGVGISLAAALSEPKQYSATAQLLVQSSSSQSINVNLGGAPPALTTTDVQTDMQLATSAPVVRMVRAKLGSAPPVAVSEVAQTNVIALTAVSSIPARAALIANTYAREFVAHTQSVVIAAQTAVKTQLHSQITQLARQVKYSRGIQTMRPRSPPWSTRRPR